MNSMNRFIFFITVAFNLSAYGAASDELTLKAYNAIYDNALTSVKGECLMFDIDESQTDYYFISVKENHSRPECSGDEGVSVKMFDLKIDKKNGLVYTNEGGASGAFRRLELDREQCGKLGYLATKRGSRISSGDSERRVKTSRTYFYTAPDEKCKNNKLFIIRNDLINSYIDYKGFSYVVYLTKNGGSVSGWVHSDSITPTGSGLGPKP
jgi:hypothetical protein